MILHWITDKGRYAMKPNQSIEDNEQEEWWWRERDKSGVVWGKQTEQPKNELKGGDGRWPIGWVKYCI